jgi:hypothetical protein
VRPTFCEFHLFCEFDDRTRLVSWKTETRLSDLPANTVLEARCLHCKQTRTRSAGSLMGAATHQLYLDELEARLRCRDKHCRGAQRLTMEHQHKVEGFVGGMA